MSIYFIQGGDKVKIGYGNKWYSRLNQLQTTSPDPLKVLLVIEGTRKEEHALHIRFRHIKFNNEWFKLVPELWDYIKELATTHTCEVVAPNLIGQAKIKTMIDDPLINNPQISIEKINIAPVSIVPDKKPTFTKENPLRVTRETFDHLDMLHQMAGNIMHAEGRLIIVDE
jgi:hypothetical protein